MTDAERARALSGATRECRTLYNALTGPDCPDCHGTGRVFILGERARKACPGCSDCVDHRFAGKATRSLCHGNGWLSTLLEEPETCPVPWEPSLSDPVKFGPHPEWCGCGGSGVVQAWRLQLLIGLLEEKQMAVSYAEGQWILRTPKGWNAWNRPVMNPSLAVAACKALGIGTEVKRFPMPTPDPKDWLLTDEERFYASDAYLNGLNERPDPDKAVKEAARAALLKALKGVEEWLRGYTSTDDGWYLQYLHGHCDLLADDLAAARARLESEGR